MSDGTPFLGFLRSRLEAGGFATDDALATVLPLLRQAVRAHAAGKVAPLDGLEAVFVSGTSAWYPEASEKEAVRNAAKIEALDRPESLALDLIAEVRRTTEVEEEAGKTVNLQVGKAGEEVTKPVYLPGYRAWEQALGHHDALSDTFSLGMLLASAACGLDFTEPAELERFASARSNLFTLRPDLNPVVAKAIVRMTELSRHRRAQDLPAILKRLENYRDAGIERDFDTKLMKGFRESDLRGRRQIVFGKLRERLFEISRRNRLLYFRPSLQSLNLTWASVPLLIDVRNVRPDQLFTWQADVAKLLSSASPVALEKYLRFEDAPYAREVLDRIISEAKRDQAEYGFAQLRLVLCFLRWHNLKEDKHERIDSPLLLLPVRLTKKKGVRDSYVLEPTGTTAEVNPVLRHHLKQLYAIEIPEAVELTETTLDAFHQLLSSRIVASEPGVTLNKIDRPKIEMVYDRARRRLDQYRRRLRLSGRGVRSWGEIDYCYERENFQPLGLRLFQLKVRPSPAALREILQERPAPRTLAVPEKEPVAERERKVVEFHVDGGPGNPYSWDFDLCSLTVGNFKYRKMSLVRDYEALLEEELPNAPFDSVFSLVPRAPEEARPAVPALEDQFPVVACDPTQASAVSLARGGKSFIIQGPPGTGKSQTITNLIADHVARGKHVLFVCEKRAALDVVFHRLKQAGLSELCSLIHDSQQDKKEFILDLKATYDAFLKGADGGPDPEARRLQAVQAMKAELEPLRQFDERMRAEPPAIGGAVYRLLHRRLEMDDRVPDLAPVDLERFPEYRHWRQHAEALDRMGAALRDLQPDGVFCRHPLRALSPRVAEEERPIETVLRRIRDARAALEALDSREPLSLDVLRQRVDAARLLRPLAERDLLGLLAAGSDKARAFEEEAKEQGKRRAALGAAEAETGHWREKLPPGETAEALAQARVLEGSFLAFLKPAWWRLRKVLLARYDFAAHALRPSWTRVLEKLDREQQARAEAEKGEAAFREKYRTEGDSGAFAAQVREIATRAAALVGPGQAVAALPAAGIVALASAEPALSRVEKELAAFLDGWEAMTPAALREELQRIEQRIDQLPDWLPCLGDLGRLPPALRRAIREEPLTLPELEGAMAERGVRDALRSDRFLAGFGGKARDRHARRLEQRYEGWLEANAAAVKDRVRLQFRRHVGVSTASASTLNAEQKEFKARYAAGRRDLEHEFEKTMRYKSVRGLLAKESGDVILDLKPIWLMSPLSVSDTLPLDVSRFDVVIFDEASQIPLEDAIPSVHRAGQIIVVGDEMQLPPTSFFASRREEGEEGLLIEEGGEVVEYDLESDSFLNHSCRNLPSTMLGWHYRSRSEALISFSNAAFYEGGLLTVPDRRASAGGADDIVVAKASDGEANLDRLLQKSLSFHYLERSPYDNRRNAGEAAYIAHLVRETLRRKTGLSLGIIAFSEAQQDEIEGALASLAKEDAAFRELLDAEVEREEDGQFLGLLVKNLENIQGDERDLVILSICYGPGPDGRMLMNFGPINQSGGEKRLNVAFSRAKRHMAVVSSIRHDRITNEYNDGARCLKNYLKYAEAVSRGDGRAAQRLLDEEVGPRDRAVENYRAEAVVGQLAGELRARGYEVATGVGQSRFRCDLAVKKPGEPFYRAAVVVDTSRYFEQRDLLERELLKPRVLRAFDWRVFHLLTKDWYSDRAGVLQRLADVLEGKEEAVEPLPPLPPPPPVEKAVETAVFTAEPAAAGPSRRFECVEDGSSKFWEVSVAGSTMTVRFGRIGTEGQVRSKSFADEAAARREAEALVREKLGKGYREKKLGPLP